MIIWINGAFGVGKSLIAEELKKKISHSFVYDPEQVGYFLWNNFPDEMKRKGDFQDIEMWREFNYKIIKYINNNYSGTIVIPMTINNKIYFDEIITKLKDEDVDVRHFILTAPKNTIISRLENREEDNTWAKEKIDKCFEAFEKNITDIKIETDHRTPEEITAEIMNICGVE